LKGRGGLEDNRNACLPYGTNKTSRTDSELHAGPLVLKVTLVFLLQKEEVIAPDSFNMKDFVRSNLLVLILLGGAKWVKAFIWKR